MPYLSTSTSLGLISMAKQPSSTAANKSKKKGILGLFKQFKSPKVSVSAFGARDPVPGDGAGSAELTASSNYIGSILS